MILAFLAAASAATHIEASATLQVEDPEKTIQTAVAAAQAAGGWFASLSQDAVVLQIPADKAASFVEGTRAYGTLVERGWTAKDLDTELIDLRARLASREGVLARYLDILGSTKASAIVSVEREITRTVSEIEGIQGRIRFLEHRGAYAKISLSFRFRDRAAPSRDGTSSFAWLNTLNVADVQEAFRSGEFSHRSGGVTVPTLDGFAPSAERCHYTAVSPDDVMFRVRVEKNRPRADLAFWKEAMRTRMTEAGYRVQREEALTAGGVAGSLLELSAADGEQDATYLIALFVDGGRLVVAEAVGEVSRVAARREALLETIQGMQL